MKTIHLSQGKVALVDDADYDRLSQFTWGYYEHYRTGKTGYAARYATRLPGEKRRRIICMHREILGLTGRVQADHRDGDGLNNQRYNIRPATKKQNTRAFRRKASGTSSQFRGVHWNAKAERWKANIRVDGKLIYLGSFEIETNAARAYDLAARKFFGDFASPNFP